MIALIAFTGILAAQAAPAPLILRIVLPKRQILVGESVKVVTTWSATSSIEVRKEKAELLVDRGSGFERWLEALPIDGDVLRPPQRLEPGRPQRTDHVIGVTGPTREGAPYTLAFPVAGEYGVKVRYKLGASYVTSNVEVISASIPEGNEAQLLQRIRQEPETLIAKQLFRGYPEALEQMFADYPGTPYLARAQIIFLEKLLYRAIGAAPDPVPPSGPVQGAVPGLLERLENADLGDSPFDEDRLLVLAEMRGRSGRGAEAITAYRQVILRYPNGHAAELARGRIPPDGQPTP